MDAETFKKILKILMERYDFPGRPLHVRESDPFKILIGAMLSHRTKDEVTDAAFNRLFSRFKDIHGISKASVKSIEKLIKPVGFYRQKAKNMKRVARILLEKYTGKVPDDRDELLKLPGVGYKTADIVLSIAYNKPIVAVDAHVETVSKRLGLVRADAYYEEIRKAIEDATPMELRHIVNGLFVKFGKEICKRPRPSCDICPISQYCDWYKHKPAYKPKHL